MYPDSSGFKHDSAAQAKSFYERFFHQRPMPITHTLQFCPGSGLAGAIIRWWTRSQFAHVAPIVDGLAYNAFWGKPLTATPVQEYDTNKFVPVTPAAPAGWLQSRLGCKYDWPAIIVCGLLRRGLGGWSVYDSQQGRYTCSRLATEWLGLEAWELGLGRPATPGDLYDYLTERNNATTA